MNLLARAAVTLQLLVFRLSRDVVERYRCSHLNEDRIVKSLIAGLILAVMSAAELAQAGVSIVFDYSLDSNGFFTPERRAIAQAAATSLTSRMANTSWARVDTSAAGGSYELAIINPSTLEVSWAPNVVIPENQITVRLGAMDWSTAPVSKFRGSTGDSVTQLLSIRNVSGGIANILTSPSKLRPVDASISFDLQGIQGLKPGITRQWYFGSAANLNTDDRNPVDPYYNIYSDFYTSLIHEIGHILGIYDPGAFKSLLATDPDFYNSMASDPNFFRAWTSRVQADGNGGYVFTGSSASQYYYNHVGQPIPLDTDTRCHWAVGVHSQSADGWPSVTYDPNTPFRHGFSELEFGALEDMGYTITPASPVTATLNLVTSWNLIGNSSSGALDVLTTFGDANKVSTVWKWIANGAKWAFYAPSLVGQALTDYAISKGYDVLTTINGGEGFWVNAKQTGSVNLPNGNAISVATLGPTLITGWNLVSVGEAATPKQFCDAQSSGVTTLWAWDATNSAWYFYAPSLDANGGLSTYIASKGYLDFTAANKTLGNGTGFWVNKP